MAAMSNFDVASGLWLLSFREKPTITCIRENLNPDPDPTYPHLLPLCQSATILTIRTVENNGIN